MNKRQFTHIMDKAPQNLSNNDHNYSKISQEDFYRVKYNLKNILYKGPNIFCCVCLKSERSTLLLLDFTVTNVGTVEGMMWQMFSEADLKNLLSNYMCDICLTSLEKAYSFITTVRNTTRIMASYLDQLNEQIDTINNQVTSTGGFSIANTVLLIQNYIEKPEDEQTSKVFHVADNICDDYEASEVHSYDSREDYKEDISLYNPISICHICGQSFQHKSALLQHMTNMHKEGQTTEDFHVADNICNEDNKEGISLYNPVSICDICGQSFQYKSALIYHITNMHKQRKQKSRRKTTSKFKIAKRIRYACSDCPKRPCIHETYLVAAFREKMGGQKLYTCKDCEYAATSKMYLISHINKVHLGLNSHLCDICGTALPSALTHKHHLKQHHSNRGFCEYCDKIIGKDIQQHIDSCKTIQRLFKCPSCPASFDSEAMLTSHNKSHALEYSCRMCPMTFRHITGLSEHKKAHIDYTTPRSFKKLYNPRGLCHCDFCDKKFTSLRALSLHLTANHQGQKYKCNLCNREYDTRKQYQGHTRSASHLMKENPNVDFTFKCSDCPFSCITRALLENHINVVHLNAKPYTCEICSKAFTTRMHLKNHTDRHARIRKYQCTKCVFTCENLSGLKRHHMRRHEKKENWPFSCDMCDKKFVSSTEKKFHLKQAHTERTVECPLCNAMFNTDRCLRSHVCKVHAKGKSRETAEFLKANKHNKRLMELFRDRRKPHIENSTNFSLSVV